MTQEVPDLHYFSGRGAKDIIPLWRNAEAMQPNITGGILDFLTESFGQNVAAEELFAYCYAVLANPGYVSMFWEELSTPGPRVPITRKANLFGKGIQAGRRLIRLHTYGDRMVPNGKTPGDIPSGRAKCLKAIPDTESAYPEEFSYDATAKEIHFGAGRFGPVAPEIWNFEVSGLEVVKSWLAYRRKSGAGKRSSPLDEIRPRRWTTKMTDEFLELLWVLEHTIAMLPDLQKLLEKIVAGPCFLASELPQPSAAEREPPETAGKEDDAEDQAKGKLLSGVGNVVFEGAIVQEGKKVSSGKIQKKQHKKG